MPRERRHGRLRLAAVAAFVVLLASSIRFVPAASSVAISARAASGGVSTGDDLVRTAERVWYAVPKES